MNQTISIVVSAYNEEAGIVSFGKQLTDALNRLTSFQFEIIWVNDGSKDETNKKILEIVNTFQAPHIKHINIEFSKNFGHEAAMIAGIDNANGTAIICMDADGQHPPSEIENMIKAFEKGNDFVLMNRVKRKDNSALKNLLSSIFYKLINSLSEIQFQNNASDFFLISRTIADILKTHLREKNRFIRGFIQSLGFNSTNLPFTAPERNFGESNYSYKKLFQLAISAIFTFSFKPLRLSLYFAFIFIGLTVVLGSYTMYQFFLGNTPPSGYTTIILFSAFSFAVLFTVTGIQLLYFEKLIDENRQTPLYIIKEKQVYATEN